MNIPIYEAFLNGDDHIELISLVDRPAIERDFVAFNQQEIKQLQYFNEEQQMIVAPVMIPDKLILRHSETLGHFYTKFSKETIEKIRYQYSKDGNFNNSNINHKDSIDGLIMLESWIKESNDDKSNMYGFNDLPIGTWFVKYKIDNQEVWQKIKEGKINGVSIEGYISYAVENFKKKKKDNYNSIFGYNFKYIELCPIAKELFESFKNMNLNVDDEGMVRSLALQVDSILGIENEVILQNSTTEEQLKQATLLLDDFKDLLNELSQRLNITFDGSFMDRHLDIIKSKMDNKEMMNEILINYFKDKGISEEDFKEEFANASLIPYAEGDILPKEGKQGRTFYKYVGPSAERNFCKQMLSLKRLYTYEEVKGANDLAVNSGFGPNGSSTYDIWFYKGGPNCKHYWQKIFATFDKQQSKGPARGKAGTPMINQPNRGYLKAEVLSLFDFAEVGPRGGINPSKKAPNSNTPNPNPKGEGTAKGNAGTSTGAEVPKAVEEALKKKADDFNERYKDKLGYGVTVGQLKSVYQRGVGAYNTSRSPKVTSQQQWAYARVNAYLYLVKNGRPENKQYTTDYDLLPSKHPKKDKMYEEDFVILPKAGESEDEYIGRCIAIEKNNGYSNDQAAAICYDKWKNR